MPDITVVCGCFGSGKTEFSINLAKKLAGSGGETALVDLDVINPMFNSEHHRQYLLRNGVQIISTPNDQRCDCPSLSPEIYTAFDGKYEHVIFDVGGDKAGSIVLGSFHDRFLNAAADVRVLFIVNTRRPMSASADQIMEAMERISRAARLPVSGLINNTNLGAETTPAHLAEGQVILEKVSTATGVPIVLHAGTAEVLRKAEQCYALKGEPFELDPVNRPAFMKYGIRHGNVYSSGSVSL